MIEIGVFQTGRFEGAEIEEQLQCFAEEVRPLLARACGGQVENPSLGLDLDPVSRELPRIGARARRNVRPETTP